MHTKCTYERTQSTSETTARQRLRGQPNLTPRTSVLLPVHITTARRPDYIRLSAMVRSRSTQLIVHASSQLGHAGPPKRGHFPAILASECACNDIGGQMAQWLTRIIKNCYILEFKRSSDRNEDFLRVKEDEANEQHKSLIEALKVAAPEWTFEQIKLGGVVQ